MANPYVIKIVLPDENNESAMAGANSASTGGNSGNKGSFGNVVEAVGKKVK